MSLTVEQFVDSLLRSGLLCGDAQRELEKRLVNEGRYWNTESVTAHLIKEGQLTEYQAHVLRQGDGGGLVLGDYVVLDKIGAGGMGDVFKALHRRMRRTVALKVLSAEATKSSDLVKRFQREAQAAARLQHLNIVAAYDAGEDRGIHFLVMQYIDGCNLADYVRDVRGCLSVAVAVDFILQAARGLQHAHGEGILHRDIKPSNLLVDRRGVVKILDLGLALFVDRTAADDNLQSNRLTLAGERLGTANYMSPEQALDARAADARSDIYALGCTLHFLLTGDPPFRRRKKLQVVSAHLRAPVPSLSQQFIDIPSALDAIFQRMLAKHPDERYQSMGDVIAALEGLAGVDSQAASLGRFASIGAAPEIEFEAQTSERLISSGAEPAELADASSADYTASIHDEPLTRSQQDTTISAGGFDAGSGPAYGSLSDSTARAPARGTIVDSPDRRAALWILQTGGGVVISESGGQRRPVGDVVDLPRGEFTVETVGLAYNKLVDDDDLARLAPLAGLARLYLDSTGVGDRGLRLIAKMSSLEHLALGKTMISDAGLSQLNGRLRLRQLSLYATGISRRSLSLLAAMTTLEKLNLAGTKVGPAAVEQLRRALPQCEIMH